MFSNGGFAEVGDVTLHLSRRSKLIDELKLLASSGETVTLRIGSSVGVLMMPRHGKPYRVSTLTRPTHTCGQDDPPTLEGARAVITAADDSGTVSVSFKAGCECQYVANGLRTDRDAAGPAWLIDLGQG